jgi:hypothetical protein
MMPLFLSSNKTLATVAGGFIGLTAFSTVSMSQAAQGIQFDWTVSFGNIFTVIAVMSTGLGVIIAFVVNQRLLQEKVSTLRLEVTGLREEVRVLAVYEERFNNVNATITNNNQAINQRIQRLEAEMDSLRRGDGWITKR